jgi:VWFA-related protein
MGSRLRNGGARAACGRRARVAVLAAAVTVLAQTPVGAAGPPQRVEEHVEVRRVLLDARVVDSFGRPILGLTRDDFRVLVDGEPAELETIEWVTAAEPYPPTATSGADAPTANVPALGRLIVFFFQADFAGVRLTGHMRMKAKAIEFLNSLKPEDRVAVVSFDSHLKLRQDFTCDRELLTRTIHAAIRFGNEPQLQPGPFPSLARHFDFQAARRAARPETGLLVTARALKGLPGAKSLVYFGWGLGEFRPPRVFMGEDYDAARLELAAGRVTVFAIDVTDADYHTLEVGLEQVAADTGGFYAKTNLFPGQAMDRLAGAVAGYYVLVLAVGANVHGTHSVSVELTRRKGTVLARSVLRD